MPIATIVLAGLNILFGLLIIAFPGFLRWFIGIALILNGALLLLP